jgi:hypothetical protein
MHFQTRTAEIAYGSNTTYERCAPNQDTGINAIRRLVASADRNPKQTPTSVHNETYAIE